MPANAARVQVGGHRSGRSWRDFAKKLSGKFPAPVRIGKRNFWCEEAIACWEDTLFLSQKN